MLTIVIDDVTIGNAMQRKLHKCGNVNMKDTLAIFGGMGLMWWLVY